MPIFDKNGHILAPLTLSAANTSDLVLLKSALKDLKTVCCRCEIDIPQGTPINLDAGFDSKSNRKAIWNAGLKPNIKENKRNRKYVKRGRKRYFDHSLYALRFICERSFAWEDKFRRTLVRYDFYAWIYHAFHLLAFALINFRNTIT